MKDAVLDLESYYDKECSVITLGTRGYMNHPDFEAYMLSVAIDDGFEWVGKPEDFDWSKLNGCHIWAANASFDETIVLEMVRQKKWPAIVGAQWDCVLDAARYCGLAGNLAGALEQELDIKMDKSVRDKMKGKRWSTMTPEFQQEVTAYALKDSIYALKLVQAIKDKWPETERRISRMNRLALQRGLPIDVAKLKTQHEVITRQLFEAESAIPWGGERPLLSRPAFDDECRKCGIEPPASLAKDNVEAIEWIKKHGHTHKWVGSVSNWRRINALKKKLESLDAATLADGRYYGGIRYFGAHTGRFSGSGGNLNMQNLPRQETFGVDLRKLISAKKGHKLIVADLSQIEVRTLCWLAEDKVTLAEIANTADIYEAFAIRFGLWSKDKGALKDEDEALRRLVKAIVLGAGYGAGAPRFAEMASLPLVEAQKAIKLYRTRLKKVPEFWRNLDESVSAARSLGIPFKLDLPSGRVMDYGLIKTVKQNGKFSNVALLNRNGKRLPMKLWGGQLAENCLIFNTPVLTEHRGWVEMASVRVEDRVFDGDSFVSHGGYVAKGKQSVIDMHGITCTANHAFLTESGNWLAAEKACNLELSKVAYPHVQNKRQNRNCVRKLRRCWFSRNAPQAIGAHHIAVDREMPMWYALDKGAARLEDHEVLQQAMRVVQRVCSKEETNTRPNSAPTICSVALYERPLQAAFSSGLEKLRRSWNKRVRPLASGLPKLLGRYAANLRSGIDFGPDRQRWGLLTRKLQVGYVVGAGQQYSQETLFAKAGGTSIFQRNQIQHYGGTDKPWMDRRGSGNTEAFVLEEVGDLMNCGPNSRFMVRNKTGDTFVAHNCSQALARDIFCDMMLRIEEAGLTILFHVHDEVIVECREEGAAEALATIVRIMSTPPEWIKDIPVSSEAKILAQYTK